MIYTYVDPLYCVCVCDVTKTAVNFVCMKLQREAESDAHRTISPQ